MIHIPLQMYMFRTIHLSVIDATEVKSHRHEEASHHEEPVTRIGEQDLVYLSPYKQHTFSCVMYPDILGVPWNH